MPFLTLGGGKTYYTSSKGDGHSSLVLIHGSGGSHQSWPLELRRLEGAEVFALDLPGHGKSGGRGRRSVREYAELVKAFIRELGLKHVVLVGHSLGGAVVLTAALDRPEWLQGIVVVGSGARLRVAPQILEGLQSDFPGTAKLINEYAFGSKAPPELRQQSEQIFLQADQEVMHGDFAACDAFDVMDRLREIELPALVVSGDEDSLTPEKYGRYLAEALPEAQLRVLEGCGHMMALEKPEELAALVQGFLQGLGS